MLLARKIVITDRKNPIVFRILVRSLEMVMLEKLFL